MVVITEHNNHIEHYNRKYKEFDKNKNVANTNLYIATVITALLIYTVCAWSSKVAFVEIIDLELPIVIILTLILTASTKQGYSTISYGIYILMSCIIYIYNPSYTFMIVVALISNIIVKIVELIYYNEKDYMFRNEEEKGHFLIEHFLRIRYHLLLSFIIFITFVILGYFYPSVFQSVLLPTVQGLNEGVKQGTIKLETVSLFINNFSVAMNIVMGGLYFSTSTIYLLIFNALIVGYTAGYMNFSHFLSFTLPHGIFELTGIIIAGATGFRVTHAIISILSGIQLNQENKKDIFKKHLEITAQMLVDVLIMIVIMAILLIIAAYIEANLTVPMGKIMLGMK